MAILVQTDTGFSEYYSFSAADPDRTKKLPINTYLEKAIMRVFQLGC